jgi:hypothetical protein
MTADNGRTFGRRGLAQLGAPAAAPAPPAEPRAPSGIRLPGLAKPFFGILAGVALLLVLQAVYVAPMKGTGRALDQHWQQNVGYPGIEDAYQRTNGSDARLEEAHNHCAARADFVRLGPNERRALEGFDGLYSGESALAKAAAYLSCLMAQKPARFYQPAHRTHLVAALGDYFRLMTKVHEERWLQSTSPFALERGQLIQPPRSTTFGQSGPPPSAQTDPRVLAGLRTLVAAGYITRRDLSGLPRAAAAELENRLHGLDGKKADCA